MEQEAVKYTINTIQKALKELTPELVDFMLLECVVAFAISMFVFLAGLTIMYIVYKRKMEFDLFPDGPIIIIGGFTLFCGFFLVGVYGFELFMAHSNPTVWALTRLIN